MNFKVKGFVEITMRDTDGNIVEQRKIDNVVTNLGIGAITGLIGNVGTETAFTYLAVGTGVTAAEATDTALEAEIVDTGLARAAATVTQETTTVTDDTLQLEYTWTATGAKAVTEVGTLNAASAGILLGHTVFAAINTVNDFELTLKHKFVIS